jgi:UDP:flavonoid glycosyltransferase YjiC (YdhE family)
VTVVFYISGHGFGHAVRQLAIVNALGAARPDLRLVIRASVAPWLFARTLQVPAEVQAAEVDIGAVQRGSLEVDVAETVRAVSVFHRDLDVRAAQEARVLTEVGARLVVSDIPAVAFVAAARAGVPAVGISNFTWDWIYEDYAGEHPEARALAARIGECYGLAAEGWRLPMAGGFATFPVVRDLPLVARVSTRDRAETRALVGLPLDTPLILVSLGGFGAAGLDLAAAAASLGGLAEVVITSYDTFPATAGVHRVDEDLMRARGVRYEDLLRAMDAVASKPGYGIISDCAANDTALLYTSRGRFREYEVLVAEMPALLRCGFIDQRDLVDGRWRDALASLLASPPPSAAPRIDGAAVAASWAIDLLRSL